MIVFDFTDRYMNMTLKSALMLLWSLERCPQARALLKTDDDMFLNPWMMMEVVKEHADHQLCGESLEEYLHVAMNDFQWIHR